MIKVVINGYLGQMGQTIGKQILAREEDMDLVGGIDKNAD